MNSSLKQLIVRMLHSDLPLPRALRPVIRRLYGAGVYLREGLALAWKWLVVSPVVRSVCCEVGPGLRIERIPYIRGQGQIYLGEQVYLSGKISIHMSAKTPGVTPTLKIGDRTFIGHDCAITLRHGISIGSECLLAGGILIQDNDGHPLDATRRRAGEPVSAQEVAPVEIGDGVWIGRRSMILKGIHIGDNAVIGAASVVTRDVPANTVVAGNPARVIKTLEPGDNRDQAQRLADDHG